MRISERPEQFNDMPKCSRTDKKEKETKETSRNSGRCDSICEIVAMCNEHPDPPEVLGEPTPRRDAADDESKPKLLAKQRAAEIRNDNRW